MDTIVALATAPLPAGIAVIRLSGPHAFSAAAAVGLHHAKPRTAQLTRLHINGEPLDDALTLTFPAPHSFTGEDVVEFQTHGSPAITESLIAALTALPSVRMAAPGEFTRRAVQNHKLDLTQAEGLADLIAATTQAQQRQALRQLRGELGERFEAWRTQTLAILAQLEAAIDFPDEELEIVATAKLTDQIRALTTDLQAALGERAGERIREGLRLAIVGEPNAGKSTLLNLLAGKRLAITSPTAGTTRDVVSTSLTIAGYPLTVADTAGLRDKTPDAIEAEGIQLALGEAESADLLLVVTPAPQFPSLPAQILPLLAPGRTLIIASKADQAKTDLPHQITIEDEVYPLITANLTEPTALPRLITALTPLLHSIAGNTHQAALLTRQRHRTSTQQALTSLGRALIQLTTQHEGFTELAAQDLRDAAAAIGEVTGRTTSEDVLDLVFSTFCIGK